MRPAAYAFLQWVHGIPTPDHGRGRSHRWGRARGRANDDQDRDGQPGRDDGPDPSRGRRRRPHRACRGPARQGRRGAEDDRRRLADPGHRRHPLQPHARAQGPRRRRPLRPHQPRQHRRGRQGGAGRRSGPGEVGEVGERARALGTPLRVGVNSGSLPEHLRQLEFDDPVSALVTAATEMVELMERLEFDNCKVSMKSTSVPNTIASNRRLAERIPYPLHLGVTEAGTKWSGSLKSAVGLGTLLADGIGDTIRISLSTFHAEEEVKVAWEILKALKLRERGPVLIACPTCGRLQFDMDSVVAEVERRLEAYDDPIEVSVLGCAVNGIGEARHADFGITGAKDMGMIYSKGEPLKKVPTEQLVDELFKEIDRYYAAGKKVVRDESQAADAREWLAAEEDATAMTPERLAALEAAAADEADEPARLDESVSPVAGRRFSRA